MSPLIILPLHGSTDSWYFRNLTSNNLNEQERYKLANTATMMSGSSAGFVEKLLNAVPKPLEWRSFQANAPDLIVQTDKEVGKHPFR